MKLSIIIVNYNVCYFLEQTIKSVFEALQNIDAEVIVVDNASVDGSVEMVKSKFSKVVLIENTENKGFSKANNQAIAQAKGEYVLLLNPDTVVQKDTFSKTVLYLDQHPNVGGLGVYMVDGKGNFLPESKRGLPTPWVAFYKIIGLSKLFPKSEKFGRYHLGFLDKDKNHKVEILSGAFMMLRKSVLEKIGYLDEDYFMYGEDIDISYRIIKAGYKNVYFADTKIIHYKGESTKKSSINYVLVFYGAMLIFARKHFIGSYQGAFKALIQFAIYARAIISIIVRFFNYISLPLIRFTSIYIGIYFLTSFWEKNFKLTSSRYPEIYLKFIIPIYIIVWLISVFYNGGFDKPFKPYRLTRGVALGILIISSVSNFFDNYRFSKALIILDGIWVLIALFSVHYIVKFIKQKTVKFDEELEKKVLIVGDFNEAQRVIEIVRKNELKFNFLGFVSSENKFSGEDNYLGNIKNLVQIITIYKPSEVIFCSKNITPDEIITFMANIKNPDIEFKIVPSDSNFIIGSSDKDKNGELYTLDVHLNITNKNNIRNKRILDILVSGFLILSYPFFSLFIKKKNIFFDLFNVLKGKKSMVGFAEGGKNQYQKMKEGIFSPISNYRNFNLDDKTIDRLNLIYAKDYKTTEDLNIIFSNLFFESK